MSDLRMDLIRSFQTRILPVAGEEMAEQLSEILTLELENYEISERCTALAVLDDENEKLLKRYLACLFVDGKSKNTIKQYGRTINKLDEFLGKHYTEIEPYDIRLFLAYEKSRGVSNTSLETTRAILSAFFQWLTIEDLISKNPCLNIKSIKKEKKKRLPFSAVEMDALRQACKDNRERAMVELLASSGVRLSELLDLDISDINLADLSVHVRNGKGGKERTTYMDEVARTYMSKYLRESGIVDGALFRNREKKRLNKSGVSYILHQIGSRAGVDNVHPHRFRRTFATNLSNRGMPIQEIMHLLGHVDISTTMKYVSLDDNKVQIAYKQYTA